MKNVKEAFENLPADVKELAENFTERQKDMMFVEAGHLLATLPLEEALTTAIKSLYENIAQQNIVGDNVEELEALVRELIADGVDPIALNKTLGVLDAGHDPLKEMFRLHNFWWEITYHEELKDKLRSLLTMSRTELDAVRWFDECLDCRARAWADLHEDFYVHDQLWQQAAPEDNGDGEVMLCVGCLEKRLGRKLTRDDFKSPHRGRKLSARLMDRLALHSKPKLSI